ncbi:MAG: hypothetical protein GY898_14455 [Proteobacteria bacterium]|nr:hypothetical protein [Pseudomonadota bacterium]
MTNTAKRYELVEAACAFWFGADKRMRSPFPEAIRPELKENAQREYVLWLRNLTETDKSEVEDEELAGVFEQLLFREALKLVGEADTDLLLTIHYPFMPRLGDLVENDEHGPSRVVKRELKQGEEARLEMILFLETEATNEAWETEFAIQA